MNKILFNLLQVEPQILEMLKDTSHKWERIKGGAVVFFSHEDGTVHYFLYSLLKNDSAIAEFYEQAKRHPLIRRIDHPYDNPVTIEKFVQYVSRKRVSSRANASKSPN